MTFIFCTIILLLLLLMIGCKTCENLKKSNWPGYFHKAQGNCGVIIFVHGIIGDGTSTWTNQNNQAFWPQLLKNDPTFNGYDIYIYEYNSPKLCESYSIDEVAEDMRRYLSEDKIFDEHQTVIFLTHSMGGLVARAYINKYRQNIEEKIGFVFFFSTPTTGSQVAKAAESLSKNSQLRQMAPLTDNDYLSSQQSTWLAANYRFSSYCAYETQDTYGIRIVERQSGTNLCNKRLDPIVANHINIVKPEDTRAASYIAFKSAFNESASISPNKIPIYLQNANKNLEDVKCQEALKECDKVLCIEPSNQKAIALKDKISRICKIIDGQTQ
jgi:triacylglycerol esterase/lipase EstA (alpha/beta hydrolase family)